MELREALFDLVIHFLADMDLMQGMNKREYYIRFILKDMHSGVYGDRVRRRLELFGQEKQEVIACNMLRLYDTGEAVHLLRDTLVRMFPRSTLYANCEEKDELLLYIGQVERTEAKEKLELILELFLPVRFDTEIYWGHHFGILDVDYTMIQDGIALY